MPANALKTFYDSFTQGMSGFPGRRGSKGVAGKPVSFSGFYDHDYQQLRWHYFIFCQNKLIKMHALDLFVHQGPQGPKGKHGNRGIPGKPASIPNKNRKPF